MPVFDALAAAKSGMVGRESKFNEASFCKAARLIAASKDGIVDYESVKADIGFDDLDAMIENNVLAVRRRSDWAFDVGEEAFDAIDEDCPKICDQRGGRVGNGFYPPTKCRTDVNISSCKSRPYLQSPRPSCTAFRRCSQKAGSEDDPVWL